MAHVSEFGSSYVLMVSSMHPPFAALNEARARLPRRRREREGVQRDSVRRDRGTPPANAAKVTARGHGARVVLAKMT